MPPLCALTVDTEEEWDWASGFPSTGYGTENIQELPRLQDLCDRYSVAVTYFTAHAVLADERARKVVQALATRDRVEIGMHIHPWNTPPLVSPGGLIRDTFLHNLPEECAFAKLQTVYDALCETGLRPLSFRGGRYSTSRGIRQWLQEHGFWVDASVVPYTTWQDEGAPDYRDRTPEPVRHASAAPGHSPLWEIPLTRGFTRLPFHFWQRWYDRGQFSWLRKARLIGLAEKLGVVRKVWLNFEQHSAAELLAFLKVLRSLDLPDVCLTLHSSSLRAGFSPYVRTPGDEARLYRSLETVFRYLADRGFQPATMSSVARHLESTHARSRHQPAG